MGVDLYAGPLPRYYMFDWETPAAKFARENGLPFKTIREAPLIGLTIAQAVPAAQAFKSRTATKLGDLPEWSFDPAGPYKVWQLTRQGLDALVLTAALQHHPELELPTDLPKDIQAHPAVSQASSAGYYLGTMAVFESQIIVPGREQMLCAEADCRGKNAFVCTTAALGWSIKTIMNYLDLTEEQLAQALVEGPPPVNPRGMAVSVRRLEEIQFELPAHATRAHAIWGLACFDACLDFAERTGCAIVRDE
jgi:hypothetical protein